MCVSKLLLLVWMLGSNADESQNDMLVIGGYDTDIQERPFQAKIVGNTTCGAAIISQVTLLTAAHCLDGFETTPMVAYLGTSYTIPETPPFPIEEVVRHEEFRYLDVYRGEPSCINDIALVFLPCRVEYFERVRPIALPPADLFVPEGSIAVISGFGQILENQRWPIRLQSVEIPVKSAYFCTFGGVVGRVEPEMICAGDTGFGVCYGDSGGPLTWNGFVIGIVSWGLKCGGDYSSGVFTRVSSYRDWIDQHIRF